jgi:hypothetical protein
VAGIVTLVGGVAALATGAALTGLAYSTQNAFTHPGANTVYDPSAAALMRTEQIAGGVLLGVGAAATITGIVIYALGRREQRPSPVALVPTVGDHAAGIVFKGGL